MIYRTALVTGASSGIGRGLARALGARGTKVYLAARRRPALESLAEEIAQAGGQAEPMVLDCSDGDRVNEAVRALDRRDPLDLVIANAGVGEYTPAKRLEWGTVKKVVNTNFLGAAATVCGALPGMVERGHGHIVGISSVAAFRGLPRFAAYSGSKAGLSAFLESLRVDLHKSDVAITTICPGFVRTEMTKDVKKTPFIVELDHAVAIMLRAIDHQERFCTFPLPIAGPLRVLPFVPDSMYDWVLSRTRF